MRLAFGPFELDAARRRLDASGEPCAISDRQLEILLQLASRAGQVVAKDDLLQAGWKDVAVGDNSIEQVISSLRRLLGPHPSGAAYIETVPRRGYRFGVEVIRRAPRETDAALDALLAPYRAFVEGRAALETLDTARVMAARDVFETALASAPEHASAHVGMANACVMRFEMSRADPTPDTDALVRAARHAREACRLDSHWAEAWATLGFVLDRTGNQTDALAASKHAVSMEPGNWRHHFRLAVVGWGEERLGAAHRTLELLPGFPLAHWMAATVHVARQVIGEAEREVTAAVAAQAGQTADTPRFSSVALHWLLGLIRLARGDRAAALEELELELSLEASGHLYARECCANTWYAIGALRLQQERLADAVAAFEHALERVRAHPMARVGLAASGAAAAVSPESAGHDHESGRALRAVDAAVARAAYLVRIGAHADAAGRVEEALASAVPGSAGWLLPIEPMLRVAEHADVWARALTCLRHRAA